jgi:predicted Zn-dependent peptidase
MSTRLAARRVVVACLALAGTATAQEVRHEKYSLPNGMTVILHEDHSLPTVAINTWYHVGAQDEPPGRSGFAHLFEHLMFMGTKRVPGNDFDVLMETGGGANNASTDLHRTNYFSWGPSSLLPSLLWLDADRLEDMGLMMTKEKLDKQRDVVRNELRQSVENAPYGKAGEMLFKLLFPADHPYYTGVIGTHEDLEAANVTNVKDFFATFYVPSNASLVVAGDFKSQEIKPLIADLFGTIPGGQPVTRKYAMPEASVPLRVAGVKRFTCIDKVQLPKVQVTWLSARGFAAGDAELQLAAAVLAAGKSSRLHKRLVVDEGLAAEVSAAQQGYPLAGLFSIDVLALPQADLARIEAIVNEEVARLLEQGPTAAELERVKAQYELAALTRMQDLKARADKLNEYEYHWGTPDGFKRDLDRFRNADAAAVQSWAKDVLRPDAKAVIRVLPEEPERASAPRDSRPPAATAGRFSLPAPDTVALACGAKAMVFRRPGVPLVSVAVVNRLEGWIDGEGRGGLAGLATSMLSEGAGDLDSAAFDDRLQSLGASMSIDCGGETAVATMTTLARTLEPSLALLGDALLRPRNEEKDWTRVKSLHLEDLGQEAQQPGLVAARVGRRLLFGDSFFMGHMPSGTRASVERITLEQVKTAQRSMFDPSRSVVVVAGDVTPEQAKVALDRALSSWTSSPQAVGSAKGEPAPAGTRLRVAIVDRPGAVQTMVRFVAPGIRLSDPARVRRQLINTILGGSFTSRLNQNLREDHGYTYGAKSGLEMGILAGAVSAGAAVKAEVTGDALGEFLKEFARIAKGDITDAEAAKARETLRHDTITDFEDLQGTVGVVTRLIAAGLPLDSTATDLAAMSKAGAADLNALASAAMPLDAGVLVLVGDRSLILEKLKGLPLDAPVEYTAEGDRK